MAYFLKNPIVGQGALSVRLPIVSNTTSSTTQVASIGEIRFNADLNRIEFFYNGAWSQLAKVGTTNIVVDDIDNIPGNSIDGVAVAFFMSQTVSDENSIAVFIGGIYQQPNVAYTVNGTNVITFTSPPPAPGTEVNAAQTIVIHNINSTNVTG